MKIVFTFLLTFLLSGSMTYSQNFIRKSIQDNFSNIYNLESYQRGIKEMKRRSQVNPNDPTGWIYQANIHGSFQNNPNWNKCQHRHWWFLAWHRAYLFYFERILRSASGDPNLTLPYWDYTDPNQRQLSIYFKSGELYEREREMNTSGTELPPNTVSTSRAFLATNFTNNSFNTGFGGGSVPSPTQFDRFNSGLLEDIPHNQIHVQVGGKMSDPRTAAQDPIFWSHHANIDRLWEVWLIKGGGRGNPIEQLWLNQSFDFFDENGQKISIKVSDLIDINKLGYTYDKLDLAQSIFASSEFAMSFVSKKSQVFENKSEPDTSILLSYNNVQLKDNSIAINVRNEKVNSSFKSLFSFIEDTTRSAEYKKV